MFNYFYFKLGLCVTFCITLTVQYKDSVVRNKTFSFITYMYIRKIART